MRVLIHLKLKAEQKVLLCFCGCKTYRAAIDEILANPDADLSKYFLELKKVGNRGYTTGFALGENKSDSYSYDISKGLAGADFLFEFHGKKNITK